jgi:uncharacterized membrane protein
MDFKFHLENAWKITIGHIASLLLMTLAMIAASILTLGILAPVTIAGYMQSILLLVREGREPKVTDIFSHMGLFLPLLLFGIVVVIVTCIGMMLLFLPGLVFALAVSFCCIYMLPLMTDRGMGLMEAIKESYAIIKGERLTDHVVVFIIFMGLTAIGGTIFIGALFTQPLATVFLMSIYEKLEKPAASVPPPPVQSE